MTRWQALRSVSCICLTALVLPALSQSVTVSPTSISFGNQPEGTTSSSHRVTLKNGQKTAITITSIGTNLSDFGQTNTCPVSPSTLGAGGSCTISVTFSPMAMGTRSGTLTVVDTGTSSPQLVTLSGTGTSPSLVSIAVTPTTASVVAGSTQQFTATGSYSNGTTQNLTSVAIWTSSNTSVATVSSGGLATGIAQGNATIKAASGSISGSATLSVAAPQLISISVTPTTPSLPAGYTQQFTATGTYSNGTTQNLTSKAKWLSSATSLATITSSGLATAVAQGTTTIKAASGTIIGSTTLTVTAAVLTSISVTPTTASVAAGYTEQFTATGIYSNGTTQNLTGTATWTSSLPSVATVSKAGLATALTQGTATITAASGAISGSATLTVAAAVLTSLAVTPASASIANGTTQQFTATGTYSDGSTQNLTNTVAWSSSFTSVATITASGLATGAGIGSTTITANDGTFTTSAPLTVSQPALVSIAITPAGSYFAVGTAQQLAATGTYSDGSTQNLTSTVAWSSGNTLIATVNAQGVADSVAVGSTTVKATSGSISGSTTIAVTAATLVSISVTPATPSLPPGANQQFTATGTYTDGTTQIITTTVQWSSDAPSTATISTTGATIGLATGVGPGTATITASSGSISGSTLLTVTGATLVSIAVTPATPSIALGTSQQFIATGTYSDGTTQNITTAVQWSSGTPSTATISTTGATIGLATSVGPGTATINATWNSVSGSTALTVTAATLVSIAVNPPNASTPIETNQQFTATGTYSDGTTQDLTQSAYWTSSMATVATISDAAGTAGLATALGVGTTTIRVTSGLVSGSASLVVDSATLVSIAINPQNPTIALGTTQQFAATGTYTDGSTQDLTSVATWNSSNAMIAIISNALGSYGLATSSGEGTSTITATLNSVNSSTALTVSAPGLISIAITPANVSFPLGTTQPMTATGTYSDGSTLNITDTVAWSSGNNQVATVSAQGLASSVAQGSTTLTATSGGVSGSTTVTVTAAALVSVAVSPSSGLVTTGSTLALTATGSYTNGSTQNLTSTVLWSTSNSAIGTVSAGVVTGVADGTVTISASESSIVSNAVAIQVGTPADFYVATNGNDSWSGTLFAPNPGSTNGPFATIAKAQTAVQNLVKSSGGRTSPITVLVRAGSYFRSLNFASADSGTSTLEIIWENYPNEVPVISGGVQVTGWVNTGGNAYQLTLPVNTQYFENLFYNGQRRLRPRSGGYVGTYSRVASTIYMAGSPPPASPPTPNCGAYVSGKGWECFDRFQANCGDVDAGWQNLNPPYPAGDIELVDFEIWTASKLRIQSIDQNCVVYLTGPTAMLAETHGFITNHRYVVENVKDLFTQPGQWFLDRSAIPWTLSYLANPGENPLTDTVVISQSPQVMTANSLEHVTFQGLTFENDNYVVPPGGYASNQQDPSIPAAVACYNCQNVTFDSDIVTQTSGVGFELSTSNQSLATANNIFENGALYDIGSSGIRVGKPPLSTDSDSNVPQFTTIQNTLVEGYGRIFPSGVGIIQGSGHDNTYTHNDIYDGYHAGMEICLPPGCAPGKTNSSGTFNVIASYNHVFDLFEGVTDDSGAIYFSTGGPTFTPPGNRILNNKIHDTTDASIMDSDGYGGFGIYLDAYTGLVDVENNLVYRTSGESVKITTGPQFANQQNTISNNIFAYSRLGGVENSYPYGLTTTTCPATVPTIFNATNNLFYFDRQSTSSPAFLMQQGCEYACGKSLTALHDWQNNLYWRVNGTFDTDTGAFHAQPKPGSSTVCNSGAGAWAFYTFSGWQGLGEDASGSANINPGFNDPVYPVDDYSLPKGSPNAYFVVFDPTEAGRTSPLINPTDLINIAPTFPTEFYNPATDY